MVGEGGYSEIGVMGEVGGGGSWKLWVKGLR